MSGLPAPILLIGLFCVAFGFVGGFVIARNLWLIGGSVVVGVALTRPLIRSMRPHGCPGGECIGDVIAMIVYGPVACIGAGLAAGALCSAAYRAVRRLTS